MLVARHRPHRALGVYGSTEAQYRGDPAPSPQRAWKTVANLATTPAVAVFNHPFHFYRGQVPLHDYVDLRLDARPRGTKRRHAARAQ